MSDWTKHLPPVAYGDSLVTRLRIHVYRSRPYYAFANRCWRCLLDPYHKA